MNIASYDIGLVTGYAIMIDDVLSRSGVIDLREARKQSPGDAYNVLHRRVYHDVSEYDIDLIVIEEPTPRNMRSAKLQHGMLATIELVAAQLDRAYREVSPNTVQKYARSMVGKIIEPVVVKASKAPAYVLYQRFVGRDPFDANEADAVAMMYYMANEAGVNVAGYHTV